MDKKTSKHFVIFYHKNSTASKDSLKIINILEDSYLKIISSLGFSIKIPKIKYYIFENEAQKIRETGEDGYAEAYPDKYYVNCVYNSKIKSIGAHEVVHILINKIGKPNYVIGEGMAESFEEYWTGLLNGKIQRLSHNQWVRIFLKKKNFIPISELFIDSNFWSFDSSISYPESGSFVKYLRLKYSLDQIKLLIKLVKRNAKNEENLKIFKDVIGQSLFKVEALWLKSLANGN